MNSWRKHTVIGLVICLMQLSLADVALSADTTVPNPSLTRQRVDQFGVGAKVKVELTNGKKFKGSIQSVEDSGFLLAAAKAGSPTRVPYGECRATESNEEHLQGDGPAGFRCGKARGCGTGCGPPHHGEDVGSKGVPRQYRGYRG